jgi:hypothetical protein
LCCAEVRTWVEARARYLGATISAVVVMAIRKEMEATANDRTAAARE